MTTSPKDTPPFGSMDRRLTAFFIKEARKHGRSYLIAFLLMPATAAIAAYTPKVFQLAIDNGIIAGDMRVLTRMMFLFGALLLLRFVLGPVQQMVLQTAGIRTLREIRSTLVSHVCRLATGTFEKNPVGVYVSRATSDIEAIGETLATGLMSIITDAFTIIAILIVICTQDLRMGLIIALLVPIVAAIINWFRVRLREVHKEIRTLTGRLSGQLNETVSMRPEMLNFHLGSVAMKEYSESNLRLQDYNERAVSYDSLTYSIIEGIDYCAIGCVLILAGQSWFAGDLLTPGEIVMYLALLQQLFFPFKQLGQRIATIQSTYAALEKIDDTLNLPIPRDDGEQQPQGSAIEVRNLNFGYLEHKPVLKNVSFNLAEGQSLAIVGPTGSGKSTIVRLLTRQYEVESGSIFFGGTSLQAIQREHLKRHMVLVPQEPTIFSGTVADNISLRRPDLSRERMMEVCRNVTADEFIESLPHGYDTELESEGANLSMGQRQLIALARALATDARVLLFDESTANIDTQTELMIQHALNYIMQHRSAIVIAHRLSTIRHVDHILVLQHGVIVEEGNHAALLARNGVYRKMYDLQAMEQGPR